MAKCSTLATSCTSYLASAQTPPSRYCVACLVPVPHSLASTADTLSNRPCSIQLSQALKLTFGTPPKPVIAPLAEQASHLADRESPIIAFKDPDSAVTGGSLCVPQWKGRFTNRSVSVQLKCFFTMDHQPRYILKTALMKVCGHHLTVQV